MLEQAKAALLLILVPAITNACIAQTTERIDSPEHSCCVYLQPSYRDGPKLLGSSLV